MNPRAKQLYLACEELDPAQRTAFLERECKEPELLRVVQALLAASDEAAKLFGDLDEGTGLMPEDPPRIHDPLGSRVGAYRLTALLGHGGMGSVYLGERVDGQFRQQAAVKLLASSARHPDVQRRFLAEREILARLQHPGIATLFDGGVSEDGTPYFVMEYVPGEPLDAWCDARRLDLRQRVELFVQACHALAHAHDLDIVHRDIKPPNVLVVDGRVKLLDFGIAKLLQEDEALERTQPGMAPMTPAFASPEQLRGEAVTPATDVYSLGLVLYELLTGSRPYDLRSDSRVELSQAILHDTVTRPSLRFARGALPRNRAPSASSSSARGAADPRSLAAARGSTPQELRRRLRGDLDTIVLRTLAKEPERRYANARELALDLERYLTGYPVRARRDGLLYRGRRFARRHRAATLLAAVGLCVSSWLGLRTWHLSQSRAARDVDLAHERDRTQSLLAQLTALYESADPDASPGDGERARHLLDAAVATLRAGSIGPGSTEADTRATLLAAAGRVYLRLAERELALSLFEEALALLEERQQAPHEELAALHLDIGRALGGLGRSEEGAAHLDQALQQERELHAGVHEHIAAALFERGSLAHDGMRGRQAQEDFQEAVSMLRSLSPEPSQRYGQALLALGDVTSVTQGAEAAIPLHEEALQVLTQVLGAKHSSVARCSSGLGMLYHARGRTAAALELLESAVATHRAVLGTRVHPDLASALQNYGSVLGLEGRAEEGVAALREACAIHAELQSPATTRGYCWFVLGNTLRPADLDQAVAAFEECLRTYDEADVSPLFQARARRSLARALLEQGDATRAVELLEEVFAAFQAGFGPDSQQARDAASELEQARSTAGLR